MTRIFTGCLTVVLAMWTTLAQAATLAPGQSVDFAFDFSSQGAVSIRSYGASCASDASCFSSGDTLLNDGESLSFWAGTTLGGTDLLNETLTDPTIDGFGVISTSSSLSPFVAVDGSVGQVFVRIIAGSGPVTVGSVNLSLDGAGTLFGTEIAVVPNPAAGGSMLLGLAGLAWLGRRRRQMPA